MILTMTVQIAFVQQTIGYQKVIVVLQLLGSQEFPEAPSQFLVDHHYGKDNGQYHKKCLQGIRPNNGFDATLVGIQPNQ